MEKTEAIMAMWEDGKMPKLGEVCEHGSLKRKCLACELQEQLKAADGLAEALRIGIDNLSLSGLDENDYGPTLKLLQDALAAYRKVRSEK